MTRKHAKTMGPVTPARLDFFGTVTHFGVFRIQIIGFIGTVTQFGGSGA